MNLQRAILGLGLGILLAVPSLALANGDVLLISPPFPPKDTQIAVPDSWKQVDGFTGTPDFSDPHYRHAYTRAYTFIDQDGQERHVYITFCAGGEKSEKPQEEIRGDMYHEDQRSGDVYHDQQWTEPEQEPVKSRKFRLGGPDVLRAGDDEENAPEVQLAE